MRTKQMKMMQMMKMFEDDEDDAINEDNIIYHYAYIKNLSALLCTGNGRDHNKYYCQFCLNGFDSQEKLNKYNETKCYTSEPARLICPKTKDAFIKFKNFKNKFR